MASTENVKQVVDPALVLDGKILEDNSIQERNFTSYAPTSATSLKANSGDIRFHINQTDQFAGIFDSFLRGDVHIRRDGGVQFLKADLVAPLHNFFFHLFTTMRFEMNGQEVQRLEDCGVINTMVRNVLATVEVNDYGLESGFALDTSYLTEGGPSTAIDHDLDYTTPLPQATADYIAGLTTTNSDGFNKRRQFISRYRDGDNVGKFTVAIPLKEIFTFARDYVKYLYGFSYTLVLTRADVQTASRIALQCGSTYTNSDPIISFEKMEWVVPHVRPSLEIQDKLYRQILDKAEYPIAFRQQRSAKFQTPNTGSFTWNASSVNVSSEKPLYAMIGFVRNSRFEGSALDIFKNNQSIFDDPNISDIAIYANGVRIPMETSSENSDRLSIADTYMNYQMLKHKFSGLPLGFRSPIDYFDFKLFNMAYVFDLTRLPEQFRSGTVNITVKAISNRSFGGEFTAQMVLWTKQVMMAKSDGSRQTLIRQ